MALIRLLGLCPSNPTTCRDPASFPNIQRAPRDQVQMPSPVCTLHPTPASTGHCPQGARQECAAQSPLPPLPTAPIPHGLTSKAALRGYFLRLLCKLGLWVRWIWVQTHSRAKPQPRARQAPVVRLGTPGFYFENGVRDSHLRRACWGLRRGDEGVWRAGLGERGVLPGRQGEGPQGGKGGLASCLPRRVPSSSPSPDPALH